MSASTFSSSFTQDLEKHQQYELSDPHPDLHLFAPMSQPSYDFIEDVAKHQLQQQQYRHLQPEAVSIL